MVPDTFPVYFDTVKKSARHLALRHINLCGSVMGLNKTANLTHRHFAYKLFFKYIIYENAKNNKFDPSYADKLWSIVDHHTDLFCVDACFIHWTTEKEIEIKNLFKHDQNYMTFIDQFDLSKFYIALSHYETFYLMACLVYGLNNKIAGLISRDKEIEICKKAAEFTVIKLKQVGAEKEEIEKALNLNTFSFIQRNQEIPI
jgi:hypothetical protein